MVTLYHFFQKHKGFFYSLLITSSLLFIYLGSRVEYEEDISKLLPVNEKGGAAKLAFEDLRVKDKIFLLFIPQSDTVDAFALTEKCDEFMDELLRKDSAHRDIHNILYRIDEEQLRAGIDFLYHHMPHFTDSSMYERMDAMLTPEAIGQQMQTNYEWMVSPSGMAFRDLIRHDPVGLRNLFLSDSTVLKDGFGGNYQLVHQHFFTPDTSIALAFLSPNFNTFDSKSGTRLVERIEEEIRLFTETHPDIEVLFHGSPVQSVFNSRQIKKDLLVTMGTSLLIICLFIGYSFRDKNTLFLLLAPVAYGTFFSLACVYLIKGSLSLLALGLGAIVLGVALSYCLHVLTHYKWVTDPVRVLKEQTVPLVLGCLTTIGAFLSLLFTQSPLLRDFGLFSSLALVGTIAFCLLFLPHFFRSKQNIRSEKVFQWLGRINSFPLEKQKWLIVLLFAICIIGIYQSRYVVFDSDLKNIGYHEPDVVRSMELLDSKTAQGHISLFYASTAGELDSALSCNRRLLEKLDTLRKNGLIASYSKVASFFPTQEEQVARIRQWQQFWSPERIAETNKRLIEAGQSYRFKPETFDPFFESLTADYVPFSVLNTGVVPEAWMSNLVEHTDNTYLVFTSVQMPKEHLNQVNDALTTDPQVVAIDPFYYTGNMVEMIHTDFDKTLGFSSLIVFIILLVSFRNLPRAILAFLPMALSWYIVLGFMATLGIPFNLINIVISAFIFGIGDDYSIFVMDGLIAYDKSKDSELLTFHKTAIFLSAVVIITGIGSLLFATHPAIRSIGLATLIGMSSTILLTYTIQPFLFHWLNNHRHLGKFLRAK